MSTQSESYNNTVKALTQEAKHRTGRPFSTELDDFLVNANRPESYRFLSEDYYEHKISGSGTKDSPFFLTVESRNPKIIYRTNEINKKLAENPIF